MDKRIIITESEKSRIMDMYGLMSEQTIPSYSIEKIYDLPNNSIDDINQKIKANPIIRNGGELIYDSTNELTYSKFIKVDNAEIQKAGLKVFKVGCTKGKMSFNLTFLIKEGKIKVIANNFTPTELITNIPGTSSPCYGVYDYGVIDKVRPESRKDSLSGKTAVWDAYTKIIESNITPLLDEIIGGLSGGDSSRFDF